jgi:diadenylate cyclase
MLDGLLHLLSRRPLFHVLRDLVDIFIVAWIVYRALLVLRGTRAQQMTMGLVVLGVVYAAARLVGLVTLVSLMDAVVASLVLILVVVFQNDIRRGLMRVGDRTWLVGLSRAQESKIIDEVVAAATELARHRIGALIAFEQNANLEEFVVGQGISLDSAVSRELLVTLFQPESANKLHDGAVVIRNLRMWSAGVFFPMPETRGLDPSLGSRHRAAIGITDETDAVVVVVSEERGSITVCYRGSMIQQLDGQKLRTVLLDLLGHKQPKKKKEKPAADSKREPSRPTPTPATAIPAVSRPSLDGGPVSQRGGAQLGPTSIRKEGT